jgi:hypothetical protein
MSVIAKLAVEVFAWCNKQRLKEISGQPDDNDVACGNITSSRPHI